MKGKYATRSENRQLAEMTTEANRLRDTLKGERESHERQVNELKEEVRRLRSESAAEASRLAADEVRMQLARAEKERKDRGLSDDVAIHLMYQKDKFIMNACRYLSMTQGEPPMVVLPTVMAWCIDEDFYGIAGVDFLIKVGVPKDGWVARTWKPHRYYERMWTKRNRATGKPMAISLDRAEREGHRDIHPKYDPKWYPRVEHGGTELTDGDAERVEG